MPITIKCPSCGKKLNAPDSVAGKQAKCPGCSTVMAIPVPQADPAPPQSSAPQASEDDDSPYEIDTGSVNELLDEWDRERAAAYAEEMSEENTQLCTTCAQIIPKSVPRCEYCGVIYDVSRST